MGDRLGTPSGAVSFSFFMNVEGWEVHVSKPSFNLIGLGQKLKVNAVAITVRPIPARIVPKTLWPSG